MARRTVSNVRVGRAHAEAPVSTDCAAVWDELCRWGVRERDLAGLIASVTARGWGVLVGSWGDEEGGEVLADITGFGPYGTSVTVADPDPTWALAQAYMLALGRAEAQRRNCPSQPD